MAELVERQDVLNALHDALRGVPGGSGRIALVAGEAGIGKTSVLKALAHDRADASSSSAGASATCRRCWS